MSSDRVHRRPSRARPPAPPGGVHRHRGAPSGLGELRGRQGSGERSRTSAPSRSEKNQAEQICRERFEAGGAVLVAVGQRLAGRRDILPVELCRELMAASAGEPATRDPAATRATALEELLPQGWTVDGEAIAIRTVTRVYRARTDLGESFRLEAPFPEGLAALQAPKLERDADEALAKADLALSKAVRRELVLRAVAEARAELAPSSRVGALLAMADVEATVPELEMQLAKHGVLAWKRPDSSPVMGLAGPAWHEPGPVDTDLGSWWRRDPPPAETVALAQRLAWAWLCQALRGPAVPAAPSWDDVVFSADAQPLLSAGASAESDPIVQRALSRWLGALIDESPEEVLGAWLELFEIPLADPAHLQSTRQRLLMATPQLGCPDPSTHGRLAEKAVTLWRISLDSGLRAKPVSESFLIGLCRLDALLFQLAPREDAIAVAAGRVVIEQEKRAWGAYFDPARWRQDLLPLDQLFAGLDTVLSPLVDGELKVQVDLPAHPQSRQQKSWSSRACWAGAVLLVLCALQVSSVWLSSAALLTAGLLLGSGTDAR